MWIRAATGIINTDRLIGINDPVPTANLEDVDPKEGAWSVTAIADMAEGAQDLLLFQCELKAEADEFFNRLSNALLPQPWGKRTEGWGDIPRGQGEVERRQQSRVYQRPGLGEPAIPPAPQQCMWYFGKGKDDPNEQRCKLADGHTGLHSFQMAQEEKA